MPDEALLPIGECLSENRSDLRNFRLICRAIVGPATEAFAKKWLSALKIKVMKAEVEKMFEVLGGPSGLGSWTEEVSLVFQDTPKDQTRIRDIDNVIRRAKSNSLGHSLLLDEERQHLQRRLHAEEDRLNIPRLLSLFNSMTTLKITSLNEISMRTQLPLRALRYAMGSSSIRKDVTIGVNVTRLELCQCRLSTRDILPLLNTFPSLTRPTLSNPLAETWPGILRELYMYNGGEGGHKLKFLSLQGPSYVGFRFLPEGERDRGEDIWRRYRVRESCHVNEETAVVNGKVAVGYVLNKILGFSVGDEGVRGVEEEKKSALEWGERVEKGEEGMLEWAWRKDRISVDGLWDYFSFVKWL